MSFWCITTFFNPAGYRTPVNNYCVFAQSLKKQKINLFTVEVAFNNDPFYLDANLQLRSNSIMWLKERLINHAISLLPQDCTCYAWLDSDILFADDAWATKTEQL